MKKLISVSVVVLIFAMTLCACGVAEKEKIAELSGTWYSIQADTAERAEALLDGIQAYDEEKALADLDSLNYALCYEFDAEKNYRIGYDKEGMVECTRQFLDGYFHDLYEGRTTLNIAYGIDFTDFTEAEMEAFYAETYGYESYDTMLDDFAALTDSGQTYDQAMETGTYSISDDKIYMTPIGEDKAAFVTYSIENDTLSLTFSDTTITCSRTR